MAYDSDHEQVEALKTWWSENGTSVLVGVVLGIGGLVGWRAWVAYQENQARAASTYYAAMFEAAAASNEEAVLTNTQTLINEYASTPYAALAALELAKTRAGSDDLEAAAEQLRWAIDHARQDTIRDVAKIRLARVLVTQDKHDEALALLVEPLPAAYTGLAEEIRGDVYVAKGEIDKARAAYERAIAGAGGDLEYLRMKRDDLGDPS